MDVHDAEWDCLERLAAGEDAWPQFYALYGAFVDMQLRYSGITAAADREDMYAELVYKLISKPGILVRHAEKYAGHSFRPWLRETIKNLVISHRRRRWFSFWAGARPDATHLERLCIAAFCPECRPPDRLTLWQATWDSLLEILAEGSRDKEEVILILRLRFVDGESVNNIAGRMDLSPNAVSQRLRTYRKRLRSPDAAKLGELLLEMLDE